MSERLIPGWHGKLPSIGDFASRRLAPDFLDLWDGWLAAGMQALREGAPGTWLEAYLCGPSWRFVLLPGALPGAFADDAWAGVLMPSVDRVGRYFPFTIVQPLGGADVMPPLSAVWPWLDRLDDLAADALHDDWPLERVEDELGRLPAPLGAGGAAGSGADDGREDAEIALPEGLDAPGWLALQAQRLWLEHARGTGHWTAHAEGRRSRLVRTRGLPGAGALASLLGLDEALAAPPAPPVSDSAFDEATLPGGPVKARDGAPVEGDDA